MKDILKVMPILFNILCSLVCKWNAQKLFFYIENSEYRMSDSGVQHCVGTGSVLLVIMFLLLLVSIVWIVINAKIVYQEDKNKRNEYIMLSIGFVVFMDICWIVHYLDRYSLVGTLRLLPEQPL